MQEEGGVVPVDGARGDRTIRVLVVDDEAFNRLRIEDLLRHEERAELVGTASNGVEAVAAIRALKPDLVFLDVQMPGKTGLDVVREIGPQAMPTTIFVTAHDRYAVEAFEIAALDYLVKPFDDERFEQAFRRARRAFALDELSRLRERLRDVLGDDIGDAAHSPVHAEGGRAAHDARLPLPLPLPLPYLTRIPVEIRGSVKPVAVDDIEYITASGPYAELAVAGRRYLIREAMQTLEERLDPARFMRIHRSAIVQLAQVDSLKRGAGGDGEVLLRSGVRLRVSRTRREALERWLGLIG
jgi:two-component system LytT family response regulator